MRTSRSLLAVLLLAALSATGCARTSLVPTAAAIRSPSLASTATAESLRLGYFPNVTHAGALYGVETGTFAEALGRTRLEAQTFNAGPAAVEALFGGAVDAVFVGANPAVNAFVKSGGAAVRIVSGATGGGVSLVVRPEITTPEQLRGARIASPQSGGTQDIALRTWLAEHDLAVDDRGAGPVTVVAQDNAQTLALFRDGQVDGGWVPEPWASRMVLEGGGRVLVDERSLWPGGAFVTTQLVVRTDYLARFPDAVRRLIRGLQQSHRAIDDDPVAGHAVINRAIERLTGRPVPQASIERAFTSITLTLDPLAGSLRTSAEHAFATGLVREARLTGIYDLRLLEEVVGAEVDDAGLGSTP